MQQWSNEETQALVYIRSRLSKELDAHPRYKEVIGDRKLLRCPQKSQFLSVNSYSYIVRFFRGNEGDLEKTCEQILKFLSWRHTAGVNAIRTNIVERGMCHPTKFPNADKILRLVPSIVINPSLRDRADAPLCVEQYQFDPHSVLMEVSLEEYITFHVYCLEYKSLILEVIVSRRAVCCILRLTQTLLPHLLQQLSEETEREQLDKRRKARESAAFDATTDQQPYGVILHTCVVRDLSGIGLSHLGREGQEILRAVIGVVCYCFPLYHVSVC